MKELLEEYERYEKYMNEMNMNNESLRQPIIRISFEGFIDYLRKRYN